MSIRVVAGSWTHRPFRRSRGNGAAGVVVLIATLAGVPAARAQTPQVRFAAPASCQANANCIPGFRRVYRIDPSGSFVTLRIADSGVQALDDGTAQVAEVF